MSGTTARDIRTRVFQTAHDEHLRCESIYSSLLIHVYMYVLSMWVS